MHLYQITLLHCQSVLLLCSIIVNVMGAVIALRYMNRHLSNM